MKIFTLILGLSLHPFVFLPAVFAGFVIKGHLRRNIFLLACCIAFSVAVKQGPQWIVARLAGYFLLAYAAYGIKLLLEWKHGIRQTGNPEPGASARRFAPPTRPSSLLLHIANTPLRRLGLLLMSGALGILTLDFVLWIATKRLGDKIWDFFALGSIHGGFAWLGLLGLGAGFSLFLGRGQMLVNWLTTGDPHTRG